MKSACRRLIAALGAFCCLNALAAPYPSNPQLRAAVGSGAELLAAEGLAVEMLDAQAEGLNLPLFAAGLNLDTGVCIIFYNAKPVDGLTQFFGKLADKDMPVWLSAIAVHEATHCIEQREAYLRKRFDKVLPADIRPDGMTVQGYLSVVKSGVVETWGEALADIASLLHLKRMVPERWDHFARGIATMRRDLAGKWPAHDTSAWLDRVIAADAAAAPGQSVFDAAFALRRRFAPEQEAAPDASASRPDGA